MNTQIKTLLLRLPQNIDNVSDHGGILHPYSLAVISSFLKQHGYQVTLYDAFIHHVKRQAILNYTKEINPHVLGVPIYTHHLPQISTFLKDVKKMLPNITVVVGGAHVSAEYKSLIENNNEVDIAVFGEGEYTMLEILECLQNGYSLEKVRGIAYREQGETRANPSREYIQDLDSLPFGDWDSLPMEKYWDAITVKKNYGSICASRGCPFSCTFCGAKTVLGKKIRKRSPEDISEEINLLYNKYSVRQLLFLDSTFNIDNQWIKEICEGILKMNKPLVWGCNVRAERVNKETLRIMKRSGCVRLFSGVESADNNVLKKMKKGTTIEKVEEGIHIINEVGIPADYGFILGMPGETEDSMKKSIDFAKNIKGICTFALASPFPGTELYEIAKTEGFSVSDWSKHDIYTLAYIPRGLTKEKLQHYYKLAIRATYLRLSFLIRMLFQLRSWLNFKIALGSAYRIFFKRLFKFSR